MKRKNNRQCNKNVLEHSPRTFFELCKLAAAIIIVVATIVVVIVVAATSVIAKN